MQYDILIRGGTIVDGTGSRPFVGDVAVSNGRITAVAPHIPGEAREIVDASGLIVTPGFIDIHTHYDAQVSWDDTMEPSAWHGVTTVVMGNCGVGFAPVRAADRDKLIELMEGVEDIPGTALHEGIKWSWESFPEYLNVVGKRAFAVDIAAQIPHAPLRLYVMGDRGERDEPATDADLARMAGLVKEALQAGAVGFSTSRVLEHQSSAGATVPGTFASEAELMSIAAAIRDAGRGVFQSVPTGAVGGYSLPDSRGRIVQEAEMLGRIASFIHIPVIFSLMQAHDEPEAWREVIAVAERVADNNGTLRPQVAARSPGTLVTLAGYHPFQRRKSYLKIAHLPLDERVAEMRRPEVRAAILADEDVPPESTSVLDNRHKALQREMGFQFPYTGEIDFEPDSESRMDALAARANQPLDAMTYDMLLQENGRALLFSIPLNYAKGNYDAVAEMLANPVTLNGLSDAGAHVRVICDASMPTFNLTFWARDRKRGPIFPLEFMVKRQTSDNADAYGFEDRGRIRPGLRADLNIIDMERLALDHPWMANDLPKGGLRLMQGAKGYVLTMVEGVVTRRDDQDTGARPGRLVRDAGLHRATLPLQSRPEFQTVESVA